MSFQLFRRVLLAVSDCKLIIYSSFRKLKLFQFHIIKKCFFSNFWKIYYFFFRERCKTTIHPSRAVPRVRRGPKPRLSPPTRVTSEHVVRSCKRLPRSGTRSRRKRVETSTTVTDRFAYDSSACIERTPNSSESENKSSQSSAGFAQSEIEASPNTSGRLRKPAVETKTIAGSGLERIVSGSSPDNCQRPGAIRRQETEIAAKVTFRFFFLLFTSRRLQFFFISFLFQLILSFNHLLNTDTHDLKSQGEGPEVIKSLFHEGGSFIWGFQEGGGPLVFYNFFYY